MTMRTDLPYLVVYSGRTYVRRHGRKIRITAAEGTPDFAREYTAALDRLAGRTPGTTVSAAAPKGTLGWVAAQYFTSTRFRALDTKSQATRRLVIEECLREPPKPGALSTMATCPIAKVNAAAILMLMERKDGLPGAANNRKKYLSAMFGWAVKALRNEVKSNPCRDAERVSYSTDGFHTWSVPEVHQFMERHPIGTKAHLAMALLLFTGARRGDMVKFGRQHVTTGALRYVPGKTTYKRRKMVEKPILPVLARVLAATPAGSLTFLVTEYGKPFTANGFGGWFRKRCDEAGLPHCTAHGLKKAGATIAAENGATGPQLMAMFDWKTLAQAQPYIEAADQKRMAVQTAHLITVESVPQNARVSRGGDL
jgi:integrase